jgi:hypothetical protein
MKDETKLKIGERDAELMLWRTQQAVEMSERGRRFGLHDGPKFSTRGYIAMIVKRRVIYATSVEARATDKNLAY